MSADPHGETGRYEELAKKKDPFWFKIRQQFTFTSLLTILGVVGAWITTFLYQNTRIVVLETKVVVIEKVGDMDKRVTGLERDSAEVQRRIARVEANIDLEYNEQLKAEREKRR